MTTLYSALRYGTALLTVAALSACSGGDATSPDDGSSEPIPAYFYQVRLSDSQNTCGAKDPGAFGALIIPRASGSSYKVEGIVSEALPVTVSKGRMTFSTQVAVTDGKVTISGDWVFPPGRHTFSGTTKYDVVLTGYKPCSFTFVTSGTHDLSLSDPVAPSGSLNMTVADRLGGNAANATRSAVTSAENVSASSGWYWGSPVSPYVPPSRCFVVVGGPSVFYFEPPIPKSRSNVAEGVYFRFVLHGFKTRTEAATAMLAESLKPLTVGNVGYDSGWWYTTVSPTGASYLSFVFHQGLIWADYPKFVTDFTHSPASAVSLTAGYSWFATVDVYWPPANGRTYSSFHDVVSTDVGSCGQ